MKNIKYLFILIILIITIILIFIIFINFYVINSTKNNILEKEKISEKENFDCILILGAGIWGNNPSPMLEDRLIQGISLYKERIAPKIIMSGDHGKEEYNEVQVMKDYAIKEGVPSEDIFMDHAGFSSYDSIYRVKEIFKKKKILIITQQYHLYRALHIAKKLELEAYGVASNLREYPNQLFREIREIFARNKDFVKCYFKPEPTFLGEKIPITENGDITND